MESCHILVHYHNWPESGSKECFRKNKSRRNLQGIIMESCRILVFYYDWAASGSKKSKTCSLSDSICILDRL